MMHAVSISILNSVKMKISQESLVILKYPTSRIQPPSLFTKKKHTFRLAGKCVDDNEIAID